MPTDPRPAEKTLQKTTPSLGEFEYLNYYNSNNKVRSLPGIKYGDFRFEADKTEAEDGLVRGFEGRK